MKAISNKRLHLLVALMATLGCGLSQEIQLSSGKRLEQAVVTDYRPGAVKIGHSKGVLNVKIDSLSEEDLKLLGLWLPDAPKEATPELGRTADMAKMFRPLPAKLPSQTPGEYFKRLDKHAAWCDRTIKLYRNDLSTAERRKDETYANRLRAILVYTEWCAAANADDIKAIKKQ